MISREAFRFFRAHAGGIVGHNAETALHLARAEEWAAEHGRRYQWGDDPCGDLGDHAYWCAIARRWEAGRDVDGTPYMRRRRGPECEHTIEDCILYDEGQDVLASLGSIIDADRNYRRVVEAELALEALAEIETRARNDREAGSYLAL